MVIHFAYICCQKFHSAVCREYFISKEIIACFVQYANTYRFTLFWNEENSFGRQCLWYKECWQLAQMYNRNRQILGKFLILKIMLTVPLSCRIKRGFFTLLYNIRRKLFLPTASHRSLLGSYVVAGTENWTELHRQSLFLNNTLIFLLVLQRWSSQRRKTHIWND